MMPRQAGILQLVTGSHRSDYLPSPFDDIAASILPSSFWVFLFGCGSDFLPALLGFFMSSSSSPPPAPAFQPLLPTFFQPLFPE